MALRGITTIPRVSFKTTVTSRRPDRDAGPLVDLNFGLGVGDRLQNGKSSASIDGELWIES
jgi:hypothetical protein